MRGTDREQDGMLSYVSMEARIPDDHPLRAGKAMANEALRGLWKAFEKLYARTGRPSIPPEQLLRALLLQALYTVRSERLLVEQLENNLLFRWFVGLAMDDRVWDATVFSKNRERLAAGDVAGALRWIAPAERARFARVYEVLRPVLAEELSRDAVLTG